MRFDIPGPSAAVRRSLVSGCLLLFATAAVAHAQLDVAATRSLAPPVPPESSGVYFGEAAVWADVDGDGRDELVASYDDPEGGVRIAVWRSGPGGLVADSHTVSVGDGVALAACDLDPVNPGEEVIVGKPHATAGFDFSFVADAGVVAVYDWLPDQAVLLEAFTQAESGDSVPETGDEFGAALATGDFDGDGQCDLAVGAPGETVDALLELGVVQVRFGPRIGGGWTGAIEARDLLGATPVASGDRFGEVLAAGDLGVGLALDPADDELIVGSPENSDQASGSGNVWVLSFDAPGLQPFDGQRVYASDVGLAESFNQQFGAALAVGDLDGDGIGDLAVGAPRSRVGPSSLASGAVVVVPGSGSDAVLPLDASRLDLRDAGGTLDSNDDFGAQVAVARFQGGLADDLVVGAPGVAPGGLLAVFRGDRGLDLERTVLQGQIPGEDVDADEFGALLLVGDLDGDGSPELAVGAPREDAELGRGLGAGQYLGRLHVVPTVSRLLSAEVIAITGEPFLGEQTGSLFYSPRTNPSGEAAFVAWSDGADRLAFTTSSLIERAPGLQPVLGLDASGNTAWIDLVEGELTVSSRGVVFTDGTPAPVGGVFDFTVDDDVWLRGDERLFFLTQTSGPLRRVLLGRDFPATATTLLLASGDVVGGQTVADILRVRVSPDGAHWMAEVDLGGSRGLVRDGVLVYDPAARGSTLDILDFAVDDGGVPHLALGQPGAGLVGNPADNVVLGSAGEVDGLPLQDFLPGNVAISSRGDVVSTWWRDAPGEGEVMALLCEGDGSIQEPFQAFGDPTRGLAGGRGRRMILQRDPLDTDGDGLVDAVVHLTDAEPGGAPEIADDSTIVVRARISDPGSAEDRLVLLRVAVQGCTIFADGFESGDTSRWN